MGYYSFYRILKDIVTTIFGRRFWRFALIGIIVGLILLFVLKTTGYCTYDYYDGLAYDPESLAEFTENGYINKVIDLMDKYGEYDEDMDTGNYLGYIRYMLINDGGYIFVYPGAFNNGTGGTTTNSTSAYTIVYYTDYCYCGSYSYDSWFGIGSLDMRYIYRRNSTTGQCVYYTVNAYTGADVSSANVSSTDMAYIPYVLFKNYDSDLLDYIQNYGQSTASDVISAINETTDAVKENTDAIENLEDTITSTDYDESVINVDTSSVDSIDSSDSINFITSILEAIQTAVTGDWDEVETIEIPLGFVDENITLSSDMISSKIPSALLVLIQAFWMFLFGKYVWKFSNNLIQWLKSGDILDGQSEFSDETITSTML